MIYGNEAHASQVPIFMGRIESSDRGPTVLIAIATLLASNALASCQNPVGTRYEPDESAKARGLAAIKQAGCGSCHEIPGLDWPSGRLGPSLKGFDDVGLIAGQLPNRPDTLAAFVRNAPKVKPGSSMPAMPVTSAEAIDIAAYLYGLDHD